MDEQSLLQALKSGDRAAFAHLVETHSPAIYRLALRMLNNPQDAEDVLQETFIKAFQHIERFDGRARLSTWLYRIATNEALMLLRKRTDDGISLDAPAANDPLEEQEPLEIVDWSHLPEETLLSGEVHAYLEKAVRSLPESLKTVFLLREIEGLSTTETAEILKLSEAAVKTRLSRARLQLRESLSVYYRSQMEHEK
ncbi:MAG: sigma-70 family RNA polymerase sigma factor [Anaerolineales bacterium]